MCNKLKKADDFFAGTVVAFNNYFTPRRIFFFLSLFLIFQTFFSLCFNYQLYRDVGGVYAWYAKEFGAGVWWDVPLSKVPVLNVFLGGLLVRCGIEPYSSLIILSLLFFGLTIIPLYKMLKLFLSASAAAWGCVLFVFAPKLLRFAGSGLLESTRDFFLVAALYILFKNWNKSCRWHNWIFFGLALGFLTLARGEGAVMAGAVAAGLLFRQAAEWKSPGKFFNTILLPLLISGVIALAVISPVVIQNYKVTGYPVTDARMIGVFKAVPGINKCFTQKTEKVENDPRILPHKKDEAQKNSCRSGLQERLRDFPGNVVRGAYEPYLLLAVLGGIFLIKKKKWCREYSFLVGYCLIVPLSFVNFSVAHRYFVFFVPMLMVFTLNGLSFIANAAERYHLKNILFVVAVVFCLLQPLNAWFWMADKSYSDELGLQKFLEQNRQCFLPYGVKRKLIIHADSRLLFRSGQDRLFHYGEESPDIKYITGFDLLFVLKKEREDLAACKARRDLRQIEAPFRRFVIFAPVERRHE